MHPSGAKQAAEKGLFESKCRLKVLQGLKPNIDLIGFIGTLRLRSGQAIEVVPFQNLALIRGSLSDIQLRMRRQRRHWSRKLHNVAIVEGYIDSIFNVKSGLKGRARFKREAMRATRR